MISGPFGPALFKLAEAYYRHLFDREAIRLAHHLAHVSPETWLSLELAFVANRCAAEIGLPGWTAVVERQRVDVTLVPPCAPRDILPSDALFIEVKPAAPEWWVCGWPHIRNDLVGRPGKPRPSALACFIIQTVRPGIARQRDATTKRYAEFLNRIPTQPCDFLPIDGQPLTLLSSSPTFDVIWDRPVYGRWPEGYAAKVRVVWLGLPATSAT